MSDVSKVEPAVTLERVGRVLLMGLNRPQKKNSFNRVMITELAAAYGQLEDDDQLWAGVLFAHGDTFTAGLDLVDVGAELVSGKTDMPVGSRDPWRLDGTWSKPIVAAAHGRVLTLGIELLLAADIVVAARDARFAQIENRRGIYPFGGASFRFPRAAGWGNAMRWILTGDEFDAAEAHRIGLVQELAADAADALATATAIARTIADRCAPLGVQETLASAHRARISGDEHAIRQLQPQITRLLSSADGAEGVQSFIERRDAVFTGR